MEQNSTPTPPHHFDLIARSRIEAEQVLKTLDNSGTQFAAQFVRQQEAMAALAIPYLEDIRRTEAMVRSFHQQLAAAVPTHEFSLFERSLKEAAAANAAIADGFTRFGALSKLERDALERMQESQVPIKNAMREFARLQSPYVGFIGLEDRSVAAWMQILRRRDEFFKSLFETPPAIRDFQSAAESARKIWEQFAASGLDRRLLKDLTTNAPAGLDEIIKQMVGSEMRSHEPRTWFPLPAHRPAVEKVVIEKRTYIFIVRDPESEVIQKVNAIEWNGDRWLLSYEGEAVSCKEDLKGLHHIVYLVRNTDRGFSPWEVHKAVEGIPDDSQTSSYQPIMDAKTFERSRDERMRLRGELAEAEHNNDQASIGRLKREFEDLNKQIISGLDTTGGLKRFADERERARQSVRRAIERALKHLERIHPALHRHLSSAIHLTPLLIYSPDHLVDWEL